MAGASRISRCAAQRVVLVPVTREHVPELRRILHTPEVRLRWGDEDASPGWPFDDDSATRFSVLLDGAVRGMVQYAEEEEPMYRHASVDIFLDPVVHGRGVGRDAVRTVAGHLIRDRGHHRLVIDPAADNKQAIRCYAAVGFRPVGLMRHYERDADGRGWLKVALARQGPLKVALVRPCPVKATFSLGETGGTAYGRRMCRSIKTLRQPYVETPTDEDVHAAALQYVRKISGFRSPSRANAEAFATAVERVAAATRDLLDQLEVRKAPAARAENAS